jgi:two-component system KDP operon response regulator KdpE
VDLRQQLVMLNHEEVRLTPMQYHLLALLVQHTGMIVTRPILLMLIWGHVELKRVRWAHEKTRSIRRPLHRNGHRHRIPFPAPARALEFRELVHGAGTDSTGSRRGFRVCRSAGDRIL